MALNSRYGMFVCKYCNKLFHDKRQLDNHIGGKHRRNITKKEKPKCKKCKKDLVKGVNWDNWAIKYHNMICKQCKNQMNIENYYKRKKKKKEEAKERLNKLKEKMSGKNKSSNKHKRVLN